MPHKSDLEKLKERLEEHGQGHVFKWWDELNSEERESFYRQLKGIDLDQVDHFRNLCLLTEKKRKEPVLDPPPVIPLPDGDEVSREREEAREAGIEAIRSGKVAALVVAGGQGSRLGFEGPKGCLSIGPVTGKSLFQMHAEKILAGIKTNEVSIPWFVMTSETNDSETQTFFKKNGYFGLSKENVIFFKQRMVPALDERGKMILDARNHLFENPNGHGGVFPALRECGALDRMREQKIGIISYFQVDNVLISILDPVFIGYHVLRASEMSSKVLRKRHDLEKLGVFGLIDGKLSVLEYSEMTESMMRERNPDGSRKFDAGSIAVHLLDVDFSRSIAERFQLPFHVAKKRIPFLNQDGILTNPEKPNGYKFETFLFEALPLAANPLVFEVRREEEFSPVKNASGEDSIQTAQQDLNRVFGQWLREAGIGIPDLDPAVCRVEISPLVAPDREAFLKVAPKLKRMQWKENGFYIGPKDL